MKIETVSGSKAFERSGSPSVESLESRLLAASQELPASKRPDPEFERVYQMWLAMEGQGAKAIYEFLRSLRGADGQSPAYNGAKALMVITQQVLVRLNDEKLGDSLLFKEVMGANTLAFSVELFMKSFIFDVFQPKGDDSWEKSEW